jgi:hypothetical protein
MFAEVEAIAVDPGDDEGGWAVMYDPDRAPPGALDHLAMYVGEELPVGLSDALRREQIKDRPNQARGTNGAIWTAALRRLTGGRTVTLIERDGAVDRLTVITYASETPDPVGTQQDIARVVAADTILNYETRVGQSWDQVRVAHPTWADVAASYANWSDVFTTLPAGSMTFNRPAP